jgi:2,3-bisphosphoglycerate-independent phosphoglycerate mutase
MKYIVVLGDGMADRSLKALNGKTPLEVAKKPNMDFISRNGRSGLLETLSEDMPLGSDIANLRILGYDPKKYYTGGRGSLEAASRGVKLGKDDIAFRCNLITEENGILKDYSGGHISTSEAGELVKFVGDKFGSRGIEFHPGVSYRHILVLRSVRYSTAIQCTPPHDMVGGKIEGNLAKPIDESGKETADLLNKFTLESKNLLETHPVNLRRREDGKPMANMLWFWGAGRRLELPKFRERFGINGALISAVDLLRGIAVYLGLDVIDVPGATGYLDTDYEGKADKAIESLKKSDLVYIHVESPDEAGHEGSIEKKIKAIEDLDKRLIGRILPAFGGKEFTIAVLPDHATPVEVRTHTLDPVPFAIFSMDGKADSVEFYSEKAAREGSYGVRKGTEFMNLLLGR